MRTLLFLFAFTFIVCQYKSVAQDELDKLRANIPGEPGKDYPTFGFKKLCEINPRNPGCGGSGGKAKGGGGGGSSGGGRNGSRKKNGGGSPRRKNQNGNRASSPPAAASQGQKGNGRSNKGSNTDYAAQVAQGNIPGTAGKDYPVNSLSAWRKRPGYENIELAPADLVVAGYPFPNGGGGGGGGGRKNKKRPGATASAAAASPAAASPSPTSSSGGSGYCPGGSLQGCIGFCPSDDNGEEFSSCVADCGNQCPT